MFDSSTMYTYWKNDYHQGDKMLGMRGKKINKVFWKACHLLKFG